MGTVPQDRRETDQPRKRMFGLLLILPGLLTAAPASLSTKHVVKAPSPIYTAPVYNEHTGQGINHGYGQGLGFGHGQGAAYGQGYANGAHVTPIKPGHVFTGYPAYTQGHHTGHHAGHQVGHHVGQYTGSHQHYPAGGQFHHQQLPYTATQYLDSRYPGLGLKTANTSD